MDIKFDFAGLLKLSGEMNSQMGFIFNIVYPTIIGALALLILAPGAIALTKMALGRKVEVSGLLTKWVSVVGSIFIVLAIYGIMTAINQLVVKPMIDQLSNFDDIGEKALPQMIKTTYMVIANIVFSIVIVLAQLAALSTYIMWISKNTAGNDEGAAVLLKTLIWIAIITLIIVIAFVITNVAFDSYLGKKLEEIANNIN